MKTVERRESEPDENRKKGVPVFFWLLLIVLIFSIIEWGPRYWQTLEYKTYLARCRKPTKVYSNFLAPIPKGFTAHGMDISHFCCPANWMAIKAMKVDSIKMQFVYLRATMGTYGLDMEFPNYWIGARAVGLPRGAYHYFYPNQNASSQARHFLSEVNLEKGDLPPVLDLETNESNLSPEKVREAMNEWLKIVEHETGMRAIIYVNRNYYETYIKGYFLLNPIWIAGYNLEKPPVLSDNRSWLMWQHSNKGRVNGVLEPVDLNVVNGPIYNLFRLRKRR